MLAPLLMLVYAAALGWALSVHALAGWALLGLAVINSLTFLAYVLDKRAATGSRRRIRERNLHLWALAGGWPAAWWAQQWLRHKTVKTAFRRTYWLTVVLHGGALATWLLALAPR